MAAAEGKVVAEFLYAPRERKKGTQVRVPVQLVQEVRREKVRGCGDEFKGKAFLLIGETRAAVFQVDIDQPKKIKIRCSDIETLRKLVFEQLDKDYALDWVLHLYVHVTGQTPYSGQGEELEVSYEEVEIAMLDDGTFVHRSYEKYRGFDVKPGKPPVGEGRRRGDVDSLVLGTETNIKAMKEFCKRIAELRKSLAKFLSPNVIAKNLPSISQRLLPAAAPIKTKKVVSTITEPT